MNIRTPLLRVIGHALWVGVSAFLVGALVIAAFVAARFGDLYVVSAAQIFWLFAAGWTPVVAAIAVIIGLITGTTMNARSRLTKVAVSCGGFGAVLAIFQALTQSKYHWSAWSFPLAPPIIVWTLATGICATLLPWRRRNQDLKLSLPGRKLAWRAIVAGLVAVTLWQTWVFVRHHYPADYSSDYPTEVATPTEAPAPAETYTPIEPLDPAVPVSAVREDLAALQQSTLNATDPSLLWGVPLEISEAPCTNGSGTEGTQVSLEGQFSTRDLDTATDNVDFLEITQANEVVAQQIADAWIADGLMGNYDKMKGNLYFGDHGRGTIASAQIDFIEGNGHIDVVGECATYA